MLNIRVMVMLRSPSSISSYRLEFQPVMASTASASLTKGKAVCGIWSGCEIAHAQRIEETPYLLGMDELTDLFRPQLQRRRRLQDPSRLGSFQHRAIGQIRGVVGGFDVVRARWRGGIAQAKAVLATGVMHGKLLPLDVHAVFISPLSDLLGCSQNTFSQDIPEALPEGDITDHLQHPIHVAESQLVENTRPKIRKLQNTIAHH